jgi:hypothetical protein
LTFKDKIKDCFFDMFLHNSSSENISIRFFLTKVEKTRLKLIELFFMITLFTSILFSVLLIIFSIISLFVPEFIFYFLIYLLLNIMFSIFFIKQESKEHGFNHIKKEYKYYLMFTCVIFAIFAGISLFFILINIFKKIPLLKKEVNTKGIKTLYKITANGQEYQYIDGKLSSNDFTPSIKICFDKKSSKYLGKYYYKGFLWRNKKSTKALYKNFKKEIDLKEISNKIKFF